MQKQPSTITPPPPTRINTAQSSKHCNLHKGIHVPLCKLHLCTFCPDLCTLHLWCYPSINQHKYTICPHGGGHCLQLALVAYFLQPLAQTLLAPVVVPLVATCAGGLFPSTHWRTYFTCTQATCTVWWYIYISIRWLPDRAFLDSSWMQRPSSKKECSSGPQRLLWSPIIGHGGMHFTWLNVVNLP